MSIVYILYKEWGIAGGECLSKSLEKRYIVNEEIKHGSSKNSQF
jgi:hypothetical protein